MQLSIGLDYLEPENSKRLNFYRGLRSEIKDRLVGLRKPNTLNEYVTQCQEIESNLKELFADNKRMFANKRTESEFEEQTFKTQVNSSHMKTMLPKAGDTSKKAFWTRKKNCFSGCWKCDADKDREHLIACSANKKEAPKVKILTATDKQDVVSLKAITSSQPSIRMEVNVEGKTIQALLDTQATG
jgi:hypothetical protein